VKPKDTDNNPAVDQTSLQELLSAAFVVHQHNQHLQTGQPPETEYSQILKEIVEVQEQLRGPQLDLREKTALVARRVRQLTQGSGSAIGFLSGSELEYYAATGSAASQAGTKMPRDSSFAHECLRTGQLLQCPSADTDPRLSPEQCRALGVKALIAVALKHEGVVAGVLEVHFSQVNSFDEPQIRTCQLVSGLVEEAILKPLRGNLDDAVESGISQLTNPQSTNPAKRARVSQISNGNDTKSLLAALEKIRPRLERLARNSGLASSASPASSSAVPTEQVAPSTAGVCRSCGHGMAEDEVSCGSCGSVRETKHIWASLLDLQRKAENTSRQSAEAGTAGDAFDDPLEVFPSELEEIVAKFSGEPFEAIEKKSHEVSLPSFAQGLVENFSPSQSSSEENPARYLEEEGQLQNEDECAGRAGISAQETSSEETKDAAQRFPTEASSENAPVPTGYPPFTGFASDTNLLSLRPESEWEAPTESAASQDRPAEWTPSAAGEASSADQNEPWKSAVKAKEWLEVEREKEPWLTRTWRQQRGNIYLVAATVLLVAVLVSWIAPSNPPAAPVSDSNKNNVHRPEAATEPDLTLTEKLLISLGLADAPAEEAAKPGNPDTQVWIDVHTALYYCPGTELYGKTAGGRMAAQREAEQDQFQPAMRKACE